MRIKRLWIVRIACAASANEGYITDIGTLGGTQSFGYAIYDADQVVGDSYPSAASGERAFLGTTGSGMVATGAAS